MKRKTQGLEEEGNAGELDSGMQPLLSQILQIRSYTVSGEPVAGGSVGSSLPFSTADSSASPLVFSQLLLTLPQRVGAGFSRRPTCGPLGSCCHGSCFSPHSFDTLAISLHNPLTGGCPHSKEKKVILLSNL